MNSTQRFTSRVDNYAKYRPGYPAPAISLLVQKCRLTPDSVIADVGAGTGIFSRLLLDKGCTVYAIEPNDAMRNVSVADLRHNKKFIAINGTAEATTLNDKSVDLIVCAQAFHWFDARKTREEFSRILKPGGRVALIWNNRQVEADAFSIAYELLLQQESTDYKRVNHQNLTETDFINFFKKGEYTLNKFQNEQVLDEDGFIGRALSSSYVPAGDTPEAHKFLDDLKTLFHSYQTQGKVKVQYQTEVYLGEV